LEETIQPLHGKRQTDICSELMPNLHRAQRPMVFLSAYSSAITTSLPRDLYASNIGFCLFCCIYELTQQ
jgi:hypothetical protein